MIVKVQLPLMTTEEHPQALVYDQTRTFERQYPATGPLLGMMRGRVKAFFHATERRGSLEITNEAPWQDW